MGFRGWLRRKRGTPNQVGKPFPVMGGNKEPYVAPDMRMYAIKRGSRTIDSGTDQDRIFQAVQLMNQGVTDELIVFFSNKQNANRLRSEALLRGYNGAEVKFGYGRNFVVIKKRGIE